MVVTGRCLWLAQQARLSSPEINECIFPNGGDEES